MSSSDGLGSNFFDDAEIFLLAEIAVPCFRRYVKKFVPLK